MCALMVALLALTAISGGESVNLLLSSNMTVKWKVSSLPGFFFGINNRKNDQ